MKWLRASWLMALTVGGLTAAGAQPQFLPEAQPQGVFAGGAQKVNVIWYNGSDQPMHESIHTRIFQTTSATAVLLAETNWKNLELLPHQTVLEAARLDFPIVKAETKFLVQWVAATGPDNGPDKILGTTEVWAYPANLLAELKPLLQGGSIGVYDPANQLKPLLKRLPLEFEDLENTRLTNFSGKLAVVGPFENRAQMPADLIKKIKALAQKNTAVVWIQAAPEGNSKPIPSFFPVSGKTRSIIVVQPDLVANLSGNPLAQRNLIYFCRLALNPQISGPLDLISQP